MEFREHQSQPSPAERRRRGAQPRRGGRASLDGARHRWAARKWRARYRRPRQQRSDQQHPAGAAPEGCDLHRRCSAHRRIEGRTRARRRADLSARQDQCRRRPHHRYRYARLSDGDRFGGDERRMGCRAARAGRALQDHLRRQPPHAAGASRAAQRQRQQLAARPLRRHHRAGRHRQGAAADLQPHLDRLPLRHRSQAGAADASGYQQRRGRRRRHRQHRLFRGATVAAGSCRDTDVGVQPEANLADDHRAGSARMGDRADRARRGSAHRGRRQHAGEEPAAQGTADPG